MLVKCKAKDLKVEIAKQYLLNTKINDSQKIKEILEIIK